MDIYTTISGDTWDAIAYKALGSGFKLDLMIAENPEYCDIFVFPAGIELNVPEIEDEVSETLPPWFTN